jgi:hypothetical protein
VKNKVLKKLLEKENGGVVLFLMVVVFGTFLRFWQIGFSSYWIDEGFTLMQAEGVARHGYPLLRSGLVEWKDLLMPYILAPLVKFFGLQASWLLRLPGAIFGTMSIVVAYYLARKLFSPVVGLIFSFFISTGYWYVAWSQQVRGYSALIFFVLLFFYFLIEFSDQKQVKYIFYSFLSILGAVLAKKFGIILLPVFLFFLLWQRRYKIFLIFFLLGLFGGGFIIHSVIPSLAFNVKSYFSFYWQHYLWDYFSLFLVLGIIGLFTVLKNKNKYQAVHLSILLFFWISLSVLSFFVYITERRYLIMVTPFLFLYTAKAIDYFAHYFQEKYLLVLTLLLFGSVFYGVNYQRGLMILPQKHYPLEFYTPQPDYREAYKEIKRRGFRAEDIIISGNPQMDIIYLGRAGYIIPWSLTGRGDQNNIIKEKEFYSGAHRLYGMKGKTAFDKIISLQKKGNVYVILDALSSSRIKLKLWRKIAQNGQKIFVGNGQGDRLTVYLFPKK